MLEFEKKSTCIVGLGKIGFSYDYNSNSKIKTHFKAINNSKYFNLEAGVDLNKKKINGSKIPIFKNIKDLSKNFSPYFLIISVPTKYHAKIFNDSMKYLKPKIILFEKPFTQNLKEAKKIVNLCKKKKIFLFINYIRNYLPNLIKLKKITKNKKVLVTLMYSGNFLSNFCHYFYLFDHLFGSRPLSKINNLETMFCNCTLKIKKISKKRNDNIKIIGKNFSIHWKNNNIVKIRTGLNVKNLSVDLDNYQYYVINNIAQKVFFKKKKVTIEGNKALKFHKIFHDKKAKIS
jgi:hypothetical protein